MNIIILGAGAIGTYMLVDEERRNHIYKITDHLIADSVYRRIDNRPLNLPLKQSFMVTGYHSYQAVKRYKKVYAALQEMGDADPRELEKLFDIE